MKLPNQTGLTAAEAATRIRAGLGTMYTNDLLQSVERIKIDGNKLLIEFMTATKVTVETTVSITPEEYTVETTSDGEISERIKKDLTEIIETAFAINK